MKKVRIATILGLLCPILICSAGCGSGVQQAAVQPGGVTIHPPAAVANNPNIPDKVKGVIPNH